MKTYNHILDLQKSGKKLLAVLIDPDKIFLPDIGLVIEKINESSATHLFVGGSSVPYQQTDLVIERIKGLTNLPVVIFPGDINQISEKADALLFLNLISGRNPDYLISKQVIAASYLKKIRLEVIPTSYLLIGSNNFSAVEHVTKTQPMPMNNIEAIVDTAYAGQLQGHKLVYLEAGSGASKYVTADIIREVKSVLNIPLIVGGGISNFASIQEAYQAGADMVVIGTAFEKDLDFFNRHLRQKSKRKDVS